MRNSMIIRRFVSCAAVLAIFLILTSFFAEILERKTSYQDYSGLFEEGEDTDVLFIGTSHMKYGVFPMELWQYYGIDSFNLGKAGIRIPMAYWIMENALDYTSPELVVIDCYSLSNNDKVGDKRGNTHVALDAIPLSENKINMVNDLFEDYSERLEYLFNYAIYHNRWNNITKSSFGVSFSSYRGAELLYDVYIEGTEDEEILESESKLEENAVGIEYIIKMIEACQDRDIEVLLVYLPFSASEIHYQEANCVYDIAQKYNVNYVNCLELDIVDFNTDLYDATHLNASGAQKVTEYMGGYIIHNYEIEDHRQDSEYSYMNQKFEKYLTSKINHLKKQEDLDIYLMLLNDKSYNFVIEVNRNSDILEADHYVALLNNLNISSAKISNESNTIIAASENGNRVDYYYGESDASASELVLLYLNEKSDANDFDVRIMVVYNNRVVDSVDF